jgi:hypothetical protein
MENVKDELDEYLEWLPSRSKVDAARSGKVRSIDDRRTKALGVDFRLEDMGDYLEELGRQIKEGNEVDLSHLAGDSSDKLLRVRNALLKKGWLD